MRLKRMMVVLALVAFLAPISALANGIFDFTIPTISLLGTPQISSVKGSGGAAHSGVTLPVTNGFLDVTGSGGWLNWTSGGTLEVTGTGTIGSLSVSGDLLEGSFGGLAFPHLGQVSLVGFSGTINPVLATYYGLSSSAVNANIYVGLRNVIFEVGVQNGAVSTPEMGGIGATAMILLAALFCFAVGVRLKIIRHAY